MWSRKAENGHAAVAEPSQEESLAVVREALKAEALAEVRAAYEERWEDERQERLRALRQEIERELQDDFASRCRDVENDIDHRVEVAVKKAVEDLREDYQDKKIAIDEELQAWHQRAEVAELCVFHLCESLMPTQRKGYALGRMASLAMFPLATCNKVLQQFGQRIGAKQSDSTYHVECVTDKGVVRYHVFSRYGITDETSDGTRLMVDHLSGAVMPVG